MRPVALAAALVCGCASHASVRRFPDRPVAWFEHDDGDVARAPAANHLQDLDLALLMRDSLPGEIDRVLSLEGGRPARDVNALDEVPCSTWFCARNHRQRMAPATVAAGPPGERPPVPPLVITQAKDRGASLGYRVRDATGRRFLLKLDPVGHLGMASAAEIVGDRLFHAAGYNVSGAFVVDLAPEDVRVAPDATYKVFGVDRRPLGAGLVAQQLARAARTPDGRLRAVAVVWLRGHLLGAYDMIGRRADDPNDRIAHEDRRSLRASRVLAAWLDVLDAGALNTLDSYVEADGRHFMRHYVIDFGAALGSSSLRAKGPHEGGEHTVEVGRTLASVFALGLYQRPFQDDRAAWAQQTKTLPSVGWYPIDGFDPDEFRSLRKVPAHVRMTERDAYWGAKVVTSFDDEQLAAVVREARLPAPAADYLVRALAARRDRIGRRYLRATTAVEDAEAAPDGRRLCFTDLAMARGYAAAGEVQYRIAVTDASGRPLATWRAQPTGPSTCLPLPAFPDYRVVAIRGELQGRPQRETRVHIGWCAHAARFTVAGIERDD